MTQIELQTGMAGVMCSLANPAAFVLEGEGEKASLNLPNEIQAEPASTLEFIDGVMTKVVSAVEDKQTTPVVHDASGRGQETAETGDSDLSQFISLQALRKDRCTASDIDYTTADSHGCYSVVESLCKHVPEGADFEMESTLLPPKLFCNTVQRFLKAKFPDNQFACDVSSSTQIREITHPKGAAPYNMITGRCYTGTVSPQILCSNDYQLQCA